MANKVKFTVERDEDFYVDYVNVTLVFGKSKKEFHVYNTSADSIEVGCGYNEFEKGFREFAQEEGFEIELDESYVNHVAQYNQSVAEDGFEYECTKCDAKSNEACRCDEDNSDFDGFVEPMDEKKVNGFVEPMDM